MTKHKKITVAECNRRIEKEEKEWAAFFGILFTLCFIWAVVVSWISSGRADKIAELEKKPEIAQETCDDIKKERDNYAEKYQQEADYKDRFFSAIDVIETIADTKNPKNRAMIRAVADYAWNKNLFLYGSGTDRKHFLDTACAPDDGSPCSIKDDLVACFKVNDADAWNQTKTDQEGQCFTEIMFYPTLIQPIFHPGENE